MSVVTVHEAKTNLSRLIAEVAAGGEVIIARGKVPAARLVAIEETSKKRRVPGSMKGLVSFDERFWDPLPDDELALWEGGGD